MVAGLYSVATLCAGGHSAGCILTVVVPAAAAVKKLLARHGIIDIAALHVLTTVTGRGWDAGVGACGPGTLHVHLGGSSYLGVMCLCYAGGGAAVGAAIMTSRRPQTQAASKGAISPVHAEERSLQTKPRV